MVKVKVVYSSAGDERLREAFRLLAGYFRDGQERQARVGKVGGTE